jgi:ABC-type nickel/cobalt efflux system permease component RcnA
MKSLFLLLSLAWLLGASPLYAGVNPFMAGTGDRTAIKPRAGKIILFQPLVNFSHRVQKELRIKITAFGRDIRRHPGGKSFWCFLLLAFAYGIVHALGPGHGKTIVTSYFLWRPGSMRQGFLLGNLIAFVHVFSAVILVMTLYYVLKKSGLTSFEGWSHKLQTISYSLLMVLGFFLAWRAGIEFKAGRSPTEKAPSTDTGMKNLMITGLITGMIPCPGAAIILSFAIIVGILWPGLWAMVCVALGMGITTSSFALVTILSRRTILRLANRNSKMLMLSHAILSWSGALVIIALSLLLLIEQL